METHPKLKFLHRITPQEHRHLNFVWRIGISKETPKLLKLADRYISGSLAWNDEAVEALLGNSRLPIERALQVMRRFPMTRSLAQTICRREDTPSDVLDELAGKFGIDCLSDILEHPNTRQETVERIAHCAKPWSAIQTIRSGRLSVETIELFAADSNAFIRGEVARRTESPKRLAAMFQDLCSTVRLGAVRNILATKSQLQQTAVNDPDEVVRRNAQERLERTVMLSTSPVGPAAM